MGGENGMVWALILIGVSVLLVFIGAKLAKAKRHGKTQKAVEEARQRIEGVRDGDLPSTAKRLRDSNF